MRDALDRLRFYRRRLRAELARLDAERALERRFPSARIEPGVTVVSPERLELGEGVFVQRHTILHCGGLAWSGGRGRIKIGDGSGISHACIFWGAGEIEAGRNFYVGPGCMIFSSAELHEPDPENPQATHRFAKVTIEDGVRMFAGAIVVPGVTLGRGCVIAANSTVTTDVPPMTMYGGSPARHLKDVSPRWV